MKTPERWRTSRDPCCKVPSPQSPFAMMDRHTQTNGSDSVTLTAYYICIRSHFMISHANFAHARVQNLRMRACEIHAKLCLPGTMIIPQTPRLNCQKSCFLTWWPWPSTLTIELGWDIMKIYPHTKICVRMSNGSARRALNYRQTHTHTHTDTRDRFYYLRPLRGR